MKSFHGLCDFCSEQATCVITYETARIVHGVFICDRPSCREFLQLAIKKLNRQHPAFYLKAKPPKIFEQRFLNEQLEMLPEPVLTRLHVA